MGPETPITHKRRWVKMRKLSENVVQEEDVKLPFSTAQASVAERIIPMSAIAKFIKMPKAALDGFERSATPKRRIFGSPRDTYHDYLGQHGEEVADYRWSGYVLGVLLPYLEERHQIDLMKSEYESLAQFLSKTRKATHFIFTDVLRAKYLDKLKALSVSEEELRDYYNEFCETNEVEIGKPMLDGIQVLQQALHRVDGSSVIVFVIS
jgi:hypothetical protein